jgi:hypothetical protein
MWVAELVWALRSTEGFRVSAGNAIRSVQPAVHSTSTKTVRLTIADTKKGLLGSALLYNTEGRDFELNEVMELPKFIIFLVVLGA